MRDDGSRYARVRLEEQEVKLLTLTAETNCRAFCAGYKFTLTGYYRDDANMAYSLLAVRHRAANNSYISHEQQEAFDYRNTVEAIPAEHALPPSAQCPAARLSRARRRPWWWASRAKRSGWTSMAG